jgi:hypothetical protein
MPVPIRRSTANLLDDRGEVALDPIDARAAGTGQDVPLRIDEVARRARDQQHRRARADGRRQVPRPVLHQPA